MSKEKFFWADQIAENIIKSKGNKKKYACASGITPSGQIHIGNFREVITTYMVVRGLKDKGKQVRFVYSWDDFDRFRKVPVGVSKGYEKYIGMPVSDVPNPYGKGSYADHFKKKFEKEVERVGIKPEFISQSKMYKACKYAPLIKIAIDNRKDIMKILNKYRKEPLSKDWYPLNVYCEKCKKDTTKVGKAEGFFVDYKCKCGWKNKIDYRKKGIVKLVWRVDWPMRWKYESIDFEPGGTDHSAAGGSFDTGKQIVELFDFKAPLYQIYSWIGIKGGQQFSSSQGNALSLTEVEEIYEPEVIRYLFMGTRPSREFWISFDNDVIKIYEDFDNLERKYYEGEANPKEKRIYELSVLKLSKKKPERVGFRHLITMVQIGKDKGLKGLAKTRAEKVKNWLEKYADEDMKFEIQKKLNIKLTKREKEAMLKLRDVLKAGDHNEEELFAMFYEICKDVGITNTEFFDVAYRVIINKRRGPRLSNLILVVGKNNIIKLLNQIK